MTGARLANLFRRRTTSATVMAAATAAVVVMAITATGVPVNHVSANDGSVWVVNDSHGQFGDFNVQIKQLTGLVPASTHPQSSPYKLDVLQNGPAVLAIDKDTNTVFPVDVATKAPNKAGEVVYPAADDQVAMGGGVAALLEPATDPAPGQVWATYTGSNQTASISGLDPKSGKPAATLPGASAVAVDDLGDVWIASATSILERPAIGGGFGPARTIDYPDGSITPTAVALTTVGAVPVVMDTTASNPALIFPLAHKEVKVAPETGSAFALQQSGPASSSVLVDSPTSLISVDLAGGTPTTLASIPAPGGAPAQPVELSGCAFGAWAGAPGDRAQVCGTARPDVQPLSVRKGDPTATSKLVYRVNNNEILLNDDADGAAWTVSGSVTQVLDDNDWQRILSGEAAKNTTTAQSQSSSNDTTHHEPPILNNPPMQARAGVQSTLHVLDFDQDPGKSILSITAVTPSGPGYTAQVSPDSQTVVINLQAGQAAPVTFQYSVVDGFGLTKSGAVTVTPTTAVDAPTPPATPIPMRHVVGGGTVKMQVLGGWREKENDGLTVTQVDSGGQGQVSWTSDGLITYTAPSEAIDTPVTLTYKVTNGHGNTVSSTVPLTVLGRPDITPFPPTALPDAVRVTTGKAVTFDPLANDVFGADPIHPGATLGLSGPVSGQAGLSVQTNMNSGQVTFTATSPGAYSLTYVASYGSGVSTATQILVVASPPAGSALLPVTTPVSMLLHGQYPTTVDVLDADYDPAGGLLTVVSVTAPSDLQASIINGEYLRIVATTPAPPASQTVTYQVSNGTTSPVQGQVTVEWQPPISPPTPPVVPNTYATVRAGDEVDVPVMATASDPDGESVHLVDGGTTAQPAVIVSPPSTGSASIAGSYIRYSAPAGGAGKTALTTPEVVTLTFVVESETGLRVTGTSYVTVNPDTPSLNTPPSPSEVDARASSGQTITIPIPTTEIDPDGDSATVTQISTPPQIGRVMAFNANSITYQAYPTAVKGSAFAGGTDSLTYTLESPSGLEAQGVVRISVTPPTQVQPPVAVDHYVTAAPGSPVAVNLIQDDIVAPGDQLTVEPLQSVNTQLQDGAKLVGAGNSTLQVSAPTGSAPLDIAYAITDGTAAPSVGHVIVRGESGFAIPPVASDYFPDPPKAGSNTVTVNVLARDSDPSSTSDDLVLAGSPDAAVDPSSSSSLTIPVTNYPRSVPYLVKSSSTGAVSVGVVHVPGAALGPQIKSQGQIQVPEGGSVKVAIGNYITEAGKAIRLTTSDAQLASPNGGLSVRPDDLTDVTLTGTPGYSGPGSLTVQVTDGATPSAPGAHTATFTIPVQVGTATPIVRCPNEPLDVVEGGRAVDLNIVSVCQVWTPSGASANTLTYEAHWAPSAQIAGVNLGWAPGATGRVVRVTADSSAVGGSVGQITVGVAGSTAVGQSTLEVRAIEAPPASVSSIYVPGVQTEHQAQIDVAQFVKSPLSSPVIDVISVGGSSRGSAASTFSGSVVTITPHTGVNGLITFPVVVSDQGPNRADRRVNGTISLQVLDKPGAATNFNGVPGNNEVTLSWDPAPDNGSPVEYYKVALNGTTKQTSGTSLVWNTGLTNGNPYTFTVVAHNAVDDGPPATSPPEVPHTKPGAPTAVQATGGDKSAVINWLAPADSGGSAITNYIISVSPTPSGSASQQKVGDVTTYTWQGLVNTSGPYSFTVIAVNEKDGPGPASTASAAVYAHATPAQPTTVPSVTATPSIEGSGGQQTSDMSVSWPTSSTCNDARPCASYTAIELKNGSADGTTKTVAAGACSGSTCQVTFGSIPNTGAAYSYEYTETNADGDPPSPASNPSSTVYAVGKPATVNDLKVTAPSTNQDGQLTATFTVPSSNGSSISQVEYFVDGSSSPSGAWTNPGSSGTQVSEYINNLSSGNNHSVYVEACSTSADGKASGGCASPSNTSSATPPGPPTTPSVTASANGNNVNFTYNAGATNGRPVTVHWCINPGNNCGTGDGSQNQSFNCQTTATITAYDVDSNNEQSATVQQSAATGACPTVTVSWGGAAPTSICQGDPTCRYFNISFSNFGSGTHTVTPLFDGGYWGYPSQTRSGTSGNVTNVYAAGYGSQNHSATATVDGVTSQNSCNTNGHTCS